MRIHEHDFVKSVRVSLKDRSRERTTSDMICIVDKCERELAGKGLNLLRNARKLGTSTVTTPLSKFLCRMGRFKM